MTVRSFLGLGALGRLHFTGHTSIKVCNNVSSNTPLAHRHWLVHYISHTRSLVLAKDYVAALQHAAANPVTNTIHKKTSSSKSMIQAGKRNNMKQQILWPDQAGKRNLTWHICMIKSGKIYHKTANAHMIKQEKEIKASMADWSNKKRKSDIQQHVCDMNDHTGNRNP